MRFRHDNSTPMFLTGLASGLFLGALAMFIFDPEEGRRRRALARDKAKDWSNRAYSVMGSENPGGENPVVRNEQNPLATSGGV